MHRAGCNGWSSLSSFTPSSGWNCVLALRACALSTTVLQESVASSIYAALKALLPSESQGYGTLRAHAYELPAAVA
jgi:hypothetical protein